MMVKKKMSEKAIVEFLKKNVSKRKIKTIEALPEEVRNWVYAHPEDVIVWSRSCENLDENGFNKYDAVYLPETYGD